MRDAPRIRGLYDPANQYAAKALQHRRAVIAGEINYFEKQMVWRRQQIAHLDAALLLFGIGDPDQIRPVKVVKRVKLFNQGQLSQTIRDVLRRAAGKPMTVYQVTAKVREALDLPPDAMYALHKRVYSSLSHMRLQKRSVVRTGERAAARWTLA